MIFNVESGENFVRELKQVCFDRQLPEGSEGEAGYAQFIPLNHVKSEFIKNDAIFIKCLIEL